MSHFKNKVTTILKERFGVAAKFCLNLDAIIKCERNDNITYFYHSIYFYITKQITLLSLQTQYAIMRISVKILVIHTILAKKMTRSDSVSDEPH